MTSANSTIALRDISPSDYEPLRSAEIVASDGGRWRFAGTTPSPEAYPQTLWADVLAQKLVVLGSDYRVIGMVSAYGYQAADGVVSLAAVNFEYPAFRLAFMRGVARFVDWLFNSQPIRRIRMETPDWNQHQLIGLVNRGFGTIEGRLIEERYLNGRYVDIILLAITRERWNERRELVLPR